MGPVILPQRLLPGLGKAQSLPQGLSQRRVRESTVFMKAPRNQSVLTRSMHRQGLC